MHPKYNEKKFKTFAIEKKHKKAAELLRFFYEKKESFESSVFSHYRQIEKWLDLPPVQPCYSQVANRFHLHLKRAHISLKEHNFLPALKRFDRLSDTPYLPIQIYLDHLRSGHNIGSILRTVEAFRLGEVWFSDHTPFIDNKKVLDSAMGVVPSVTTRQEPLSKLPRPWIALETVENAPSLFDFPFKKEFSLIIGNEEYGVSQEILNQADAIIQIPLCGSKNSLNVSCAFSILAAHIRSNR